MNLLNKLTTEGRNENTKDIDTVSTLEMVTLINNEDKKVAVAIEKELPKIAEAVDLIAEKLSGGGRLVYSGAGTSGRLGLLDAVECPPTYGVSPDTVIGLMAGGEKAFLQSVEGAEDSAELGKNDLKNIGFTKDDILVGIAASGRTPYVLGCLAYAREIGASTVTVTCNPETEFHRNSDICIAPITGPEAITGSTRMKGGTAQKLVLNMLSTGAMIKLGKVYGNLMVDVQTTNEKLVERAKQIVISATGADADAVAKALMEADNSAKTAIVMMLLNIDAQAAKEKLDAAGGKIRQAII